MPGLWPCGNGLQAAVAVLAIPAVAVALPARASPACMSALQGEGRIAEWIDIRTLRMTDGAEVRLAGLEPMAATSVSPDLVAATVDRDVTWHGDSETPDRYGRQAAFVFLDPDGPSLQSRVLAQGGALMSIPGADRACSADLAAAEASARRARRGIWAQPNVIKNAESAGDLLAEVGRFGLVEGRVTAVRQAGAITYLNFGRRWTQGFAVTISRRMMAAYETAGIGLKSFERRHVRVRGWIQRRGGPRIEALRMGQIEVVGDNQTTGE